MANSRGQAALILIMILSILGAVSVGVASRSVENLRSREIENSSSQSFKAAEAALEVALNSRSSVPSTQLPGGVGSYSATYDSLGSDGFVTDLVEEGDSVQISLVGASGVTGVNLYWNNNTAVRISVIYGNQVTGNYSVGYYTADPDDVRTLTNKLSSSSTSPIPYAKGNFLFKGVSFGNRLTIPIDLTLNPPPLLIRATTLYQESSAGVEPLGGTLANGQVISINAKGIVDNNIVTNLSLSQFSDRVPVIFDNVLYTNSSLTQ